MFNDPLKTKPRPLFRAVGIGLHACLLALQLSLPAEAASPALTPSAGCVVLVHGLAGSRWNWIGMRQLLQHRGYQVITLDYPSRQQPIEVSAQILVPAVDACLHGPVHLVGHSMGGLLIRYYLQQHGSARIGRVVMLGTPNQGSELTNLVSAQRPHERAVASWLGPAVSQLHTGVDGFVAQLAQPSVPTGIIAGYLTPTPWLNRRFNTANDGLVAVYSTRLPHMQDFVLIPAVHTSLPFDVDAQRQTLWFLSIGHFYHLNPTLNSH